MKKTGICAYAGLYVLSTAFYFVNERVLASYERSLMHFEKYDQWISYLNLAFAVFLVLCIARAAVHARQTPGKGLLALDLVFLLADTAICLRAFNGTAFLPDYSTLLWLTEAVNLTACIAGRGRPPRAAIPAGEQAAKTRPDEP